MNWQIHRWAAQFKAGVEVARQREVEEAMRLGGVGGWVGWMQAKNQRERQIRESDGWRRWEEMTLDEPDKKKKRKEKNLLYEERVS